MVEKIIKLGDTMPKFDETGNVILKKPEVINKVKVFEKELEGIINGEEELYCSFCNKKWPSNTSRLRHESWCEKNPKRRTSHRKPISEVKKNPKKTKAEAEPKGRPKKPEPIIKELREFDKTFGITDEQIVKYIRDKMKE